MVTPSFVQRAGVVAIRDGEPTVAHTLARFRRARDLVVRELGKIPGVEVAAPAGAMYAFFRVAGMTDSLAAGPQNGNPAANADWQAAREAYEAADRLGSFSPEMFRELAVVDEHLGDHAAAVGAAQRALSLDRYDPDSQKLLKQLTGQ